METVEISVQGMSCGGCEERLSNALNKTDGVSTALADHVGAKVRVLFDADRVNETQLRAQIAACGFDPVSSDKHE